MAPSLIDTLGLATLSYGAKPVAEGVSETWKGTIITESGPTISFVKILTDQQLISEIVCALVGRAINLAIPRPFLVKVEKDVLPNSGKWVAGITSCLGFGSEDAGVHNFKRFFSNSSKKHEKLSSMLQSWPDFRRATFFDELIANTDRHLGNILFEKKDKFWLIDHGHALTGPQWSIQSLQYNVQVRNKLLEIAVPQLNIDQRAEWGEAAKKEAQDYQVIDFPNLSTRGRLNECATIDQGNAVIDFFVGRAKNFVSLAYQKLGIPLLPM